MDDVNYSIAILLPVLDKHHAYYLNSIIYLQRSPTSGACSYYIPSTLPSAVNSNYNTNILKEFHKNHEISKPYTSNGRISFYIFNTSHGCGFSLNLLSMHTALQISTHKSSIVEKELLRAKAYVGRIPPIGLCDKYLQ